MDSVSLIGFAVRFAGHRYFMLMPVFLCAGITRRTGSAGGFAIGVIIPLALGRHAVNITNVILEYITIVIRASKTSRSLFYF
jgi:hypothetical protein